MNTCAKARPRALELEERQFKQSQMGLAAVFAILHAVWRFHFDLARAHLAPVGAEHSTVRLLVGFHHGTLGVRVRCMQAGAGVRHKKGIARMREQVVALRNTSISLLPSLYIC